MRLGLVFMQLPGSLRPLRHIFLWALSPGSLVSQQNSWGEAWLDGVTNWNDALT